MDYNTFLEELEKRLIILEEEITKYNHKKRNDHMMESLTHSFDMAMNEKDEPIPGITENNLRLMDF